MPFKLVAKTIQRSVLVLTISAVMPAGALAQTPHSHSDSTSASPNSARGELLRQVRENTAKYQDVKAAEADGYSLLFGCVTGPDAGAMGLHYVNLSLVAQGQVDVTHPQIIIYEPLPSGRLKLIGADFLILANDWDKAHPGQGAPQLMGQLFHYFESPNRFGLPPFYTLHVWAWKDNPWGAFVNWHPDVSCKSYDGQ